MPILGILGALLYFGCIFHAIKTGRINYWLLILVMLPGIGSVAYLLLEVLPAARDSRLARTTATRVVDTLDPDRRLRAHAANLETADTAENKRRLAEECVRRGQWDDAVGLYRSALVGPLASDPALLIGLSRALFGRGDFQDSLDALDALQRDNPGYQSREGHMLYARNLEMLGRTREAADEYRALIGYALGPEAQVRYGLMMKALGDRALAEEAFRDAVKTYGRQLSRLDPADRQWIAEAERHLA
ncbi:tetratricopeptide repeat protein [Reyranella sp.]|uniref:tetratricopeptide repeat protein n=1 Tax=Reyranella sp. TaxID=1929291 RepID=UPI003BA9AA0F